MDAEVTTDTTTEEDEIRKMQIQGNRTLSIMAQLLEGKTLSLPDGRRIGMSGDLEIGYVMTNVTEGTEFVEGLNRFTLKELNALIEFHGIITI